MNQVRLFGSGLRRMVNLRRRRAQLVVGLLSVILAFFATLTASGASLADFSDPNPFYNRSAAANWALAHAQDPQPFGAMCTWFVSHALWTGGFPKSSQWTDQGKYGHRATGTQAEWLVPKFLEYFPAHFSTFTSDITPALRTNAVPDAEIGDVLEYDWEGDGTLDHLAFIVNFAPGQYPEVSEMGTLGWLAAAFHGSSGYVKRGWTWSANDHKFLQAKYPNMKVHLLHINGGYIVPPF